MNAESEFPALATPSLQLRQIRPDDIQSVFDLFSRPEVVEFHDLPVFRERAEAERVVGSWADRWNARVGMRWALAESATGRFVGTAGFNAWSPAMRNASIGYDLVPEFWGRGYASEAVLSMVAAAFAGVLPCGALHRIQADVMPENVRSRRVLERLGFHHEGVRRDAGFWKGRHHDLACYSLLASDEFEHIMT